MSENDIREADELDEIFVDRNTPPDKKIIVDTLRYLVTIDGQGIVQFTEKGEKLKDGPKVLVYLVCRKAMSLKEVIKPDEEAIGPKGISNKIGVGLSNTKKIINRTFKKLLTNAGGKYSIPNYNLKRVQKIISESGGLKKYE